jgi:hypothetical protein
MPSPTQTNLCESVCAFNTQRFPFLKEKWPQRRINGHGGIYAFLPFILDPGCALSFFWMQKKIEQNGS